MRELSFPPSLAAPDVADSVRTLGPRRTTALTGGRNAAGGACCLRGGSLFPGARVQESHHWLQENTLTLHVLCSSNCKDISHPQVCKHRVGRSQLGRRKEMPSSSHQWRRMSLLRSATSSPHWLGCWRIDKTINQILRARGSSPGAPNCSLRSLCHTMDAAFFELCISNSGRPAAQALTDFVSAAVNASTCGYSLDAVMLQLALEASPLSPSKPASDDVILPHPRDDGASGTSADYYSSEFRLTSAGYRLTSSEQNYRDQWLQIIFLTMDRARQFKARQDPEGRGPEAPKRISHDPQSQVPQENHPNGNQSGDGSPHHELREGVLASPSSALSSRGWEDQPNSGINKLSSQDDVTGGSSDVGGNEFMAEAYPPWMEAIVDRVILGQWSGEEQSAVRFDRALATGGASGGVASERVVIAPQWVPATQLILLTMKVKNESGHK